MKMEKSNISDIVEVYTKISDSIQVKEGLILLILALSGAVSFLVHYILIIFGISNNPFTIFSILGLLLFVIAITWSKFYRKVVYF